MFSGNQLRGDSREGKQEDVAKAQFLHAELQLTAGSEWYAGPFSAKGSIFGSPVEVGVEELGIDL